MKGVNSERMPRNVAWCGSAIFVALVVGCGGGSLGLPETQRQTPEQVLKQALTLLREATPSQATYTNAVQQLNTYISLMPQGTFNWTLSDATRTVARELIAGLPPRTIKRAGGEEDPFTQEYQIRALEQRVFDRVDAAYLNRAFLFQDAVEELKEDVGPQPREPGPDLHRWQRRFAEHVFAWCMRHVQYASRPADLDSWPAHEVLRRGTGDAEERASVFLALLEQTDLTGCVVLRPSSDSTADTPVYSLWFVGVLVGDDLLLFDTQHGEMVRDNHGRPVTLRQILREPEWLSVLPAPQRPKTDEFKEIRLGLFAELPALSPKMQSLEKWLGEDRKVNLYVDLQARRRRLEEARLDVPIVYWRDRQRSWFPGLCTARFVINPLNQPRYYPRTVVVTDHRGRGHVKFLDGPIVPRSYWTPKWAMEIAERLPPYAADRLFRTFDNLVLRLRIEPGGARDLLVRGQVLQALAVLEQTERDIDEKLATFYRRMGGDFSSTGSDDPVLAFRNKWAPELIRLYQQFELRRLQTPPGSRDSSLAELTSRIEALWKQHTATLYYLNYDWAAPEMVEQITYFTALGRLDWAIRLEMRLPEQPSQTQMNEVKREYETALYWLKRYQALVAVRSRRQWEHAVTQLLPLAEHGVRRLQARVQGQEPDRTPDRLPYSIAASPQ